MLVLELICRTPAYGYELLTQLKARSNGQFSLKEGTLYPILYRLEDDGMIEASWSQGEGRTTPKKVYSPTPLGKQKNAQQKQTWQEFIETVNLFWEDGSSK